jgi:hypothetical protein
MELEHDSIIDLRDLEELAEKAVEVFNDEDSEEDEKEEAKELLEKFESFLSETGYAVSEPEDYAYSFRALADSRDTTLIADSYFTDYVEELVTDCGYISRDFPGWIHIDWEKTADDVKVDYSRYTIDGQEYWLRD